MKSVKNIASIVSLIKPNATLVLHSGCSEPGTLAHQIASGADHPLNLVTFMSMGPSPYVLPNVRIRTFYPGRGLRKSIAGGQVELLRCPLSKIPNLFTGGEIRADFLLLKVSPPDEHGRTTLGISVDYMRAVLDQNPVVIAVIDPRVPRTCGDVTVLPEEIDYVVESSEPPQEVISPNATDIDRSIANNVAGLVRNGAVIQTGIGALPDLVLGQLSHLRDLGIHTGIVTDAIVPLLKSGAVTNAGKSHFPGRCVTTIAAGSQAFYDYLHNNSDIEFHPCSVTHDAKTLASIEGLVSINSVLEVDLDGRANAERIDGRVIAGPGGLPDFSAGASRAKGGMSIIALRATSPQGDRSNIRVALGSDAPVSAEAQNIDYIVTEFGVAHIRGLSPIDRARALIAIAHPEWRATLRRGMELPDPPRRETA
jgi:4-hydroxybutyrate CoA-transferase